MGWSRWVSVSVAEVLGWMAGGRPVGPPATPARAWREPPDLARCGSLRSRVLLRLLELSLELLAVGVDFLLDRLLGARERLVELLLHARLPDHDQRRLSGLQRLAELLGVLARDALAEVPAKGTGGAADGGRADHRRSEQRSDQRTDRDPAPGAVLSRLLVLVNVNLAVGALVDHRGVIRADELLGVQLEQDV